MDIEPISFEDNHPQQDCIQIGTSTFRFTYGIATSCVSNRVPIKIEEEGVSYLLINEDLKIDLS